MGTSTIANLGGLLDASAFPGADIGAKVNAAYALLPAGNFTTQNPRGGTVHIPRGSYTFTTAINANTRYKPLMLDCDVGTTLVWAGTGTSTIFNTGESDSPNSGINNCKFYGPGTTTQAVAVEIGGTFGTRNFTMNNVEIQNFGTTGAVQTGNNAYILKFQNDFVHHNGKDFYSMSFNNAGEQFVFDGGNWADCKQVGNDANNCLDFGSGAENIRITNVGIQDAQLHFRATTRNVYISGSNIESPAGDNIAAYIPILIDNDSNINVDIEGTSFVQGTTANCPTTAIQNGGTLTLGGITAESYAGCTIANLITNTGNGWTKVYSINKQDSAYTTLWTSTGGTGNIQFQIQDNGNVGIATTTAGTLFSVGNTGGINMSLATSSWNTIGGINIKSGCYAVGGVCITGGSSSLIGTIGQVPYFSSANTAVGTSTLTIGTNSGVVVDNTLSLVTNQSPAFTVKGASLFGIGGYTWTPATYPNFFVQDGLTPTLVGGDVNAFTLTNNVRKITRLASPPYTLGSTLPIAMIFADNNGTDNLLDIGGGTSGMNAATVIKFFTGTGTTTTTGTEAMRIASSSNVGIGTTSPYAKLSIQAAIGNTNQTLFAISSSSLTTTNNLLRVGNRGGLHVGLDTDVGAFNSNVLDIIQANGLDLSANIQNFSAGVATFVTMQANSNYNALQLIGTGASWNVGEFGSTAFVVNDATNSRTPFAIDIGSPTNSLVIKASGNVGIGTSTPWGQLSINPIATNATAPSFVIGSSTATKFVVNNAGFVGIGTSSPVRDLVVTGSDPLAALGPRIRIDSAGNGTATSSPGFELSTNSIRNWGIFNNTTAVPTTDNSLRFRDVNAVDVLTLLPGGKIGVGTTTPYATLSAVSGSLVTPAFAIATSTSGRALFVIDANGHPIYSGNTPTCNANCTFGQGNDARFRITSGAAVTSMTVTFAKTWGTLAPICIANEGGGGTVAVTASSTPTTVVITALSILTGADIEVMCDGIQ